MKLLFTSILFVACFAGAFAQYSGGPLIPEQAAYDVNYYDIDLNIHPDMKMIDGSVLCRVRIVEPIDTLVLDLVNYYTIDSIILSKNNGGYSTTNFTHIDGFIKIAIPGGTLPDDMISARVFYHQQVIIPANKTVIIWKLTPAGNPWISSACEDYGANWWWPCKDHPSDEPDSVSLSFTVPNPLECISNGRFMDSIDNGNGTSTFDWFVSTPINNYCIAINVADYLLITENYPSMSGDTIPFYFWVIPENYEQALAHMDVFRNEFEFLETINGPFPFATDKHAFVNTWLWGMEHQTIVAYGADFQVDEYGMDYIHYHELSHEWWGNLVTAKHWNDVWIHEGIATYTEALYTEYQLGISFYHEHMNNILFNTLQVSHDYALAPREEQEANALFENDPYWRGASVLHTLRYHLGDSVFMELLARWAYPDSTDFDNTNGRLCRLMTTDDMMNQAEEVTGRELDNFFEVFFREVEFPVLIVDREADTSWFSWSTETNVPLDLNVPVLLNGIPQTVMMNEGEGYLAISVSDTLVIDPDKWILMKKPVVTGIPQIGSNPGKEILSQNYPNPFSGNTTITFTIDKPGFVNIKLTDNHGKLIKTLVNENMAAGTHQVSLSARDLKPGIYFYTLTADEINLTRKMQVQ